MKRVPSSCLSANRSGRDFRRNERGFGFVTIDPEEPDIFILKEAIDFAMDGDIVMIDIHKTAGSVFRSVRKAVLFLLKNGRFSNFIGEFTALMWMKLVESDLFGYVTPKDKKSAQFKVLLRRKAFNQWITVSWSLRSLHILRRICK